MNNKLAAIIKEQQIDKSDVTKLVEAFGGPFEEAGDVLSTYKDISVTDETDVEGMKKAREARLILKKARTTIESNRKALKADIVKQGRAIDGVARMVKEEIEPAEQYLESQERFAVIKAAERAAKLKAERVEKLMKYTDDVSMYNLDTMTPEQFDSLLETLKTQHEAELKRIADEEAAAEEARQAEAQRLREQEEENARLKAEAAERDRKEAEERAEREALEAARIESRTADLDKIGFPVNEVVYGYRISGLELSTSTDEEWADILEQAQERIRLYKERKAQEAEKERKLAEERAAREKLESEERERKAAEERKREEEAESERQAMLAPDKQKLLSLAQAFDTIRTSKMPAVKSNQAQKLINEVEEKLTQLSNYLVDGARKL